MLRFVTTADTEILATAAAVRQLPDGFPDVRCFNPGLRGGPELVDEILDDEAAIVLVRILGGRRGWPEGFDELRRRCVRRGIPLVAMGGESLPDAEMTALSLAPSGAVAQVGEYLRHGDVDNVEQMLRFLTDTFLLEGFGFDAPREVADLGVYVPGEGDMRLGRALERHDPDRPTIGICFYRSHRLTGNTDFVDGLCAAIEAAGANALAVWCYTLRRAPDGTVPALALLDGHIDALLTTMLATGGSGAADGQSATDPTWQDWDATALAELDVPVLQAIASTQPRAVWEEGDSGLSPLDAATQVAIPEFDGRLMGGVFSFKERVLIEGDDAEDSPVGAAVPRYVPDPERAARVAGLAVRHARLRTLPAAQRRVAVLLTSFPTKHARVGMAVGLDTPASALKLLDALHADGMQVDRRFAHQVGDRGKGRVSDLGDELMHALIETGGHDADFLTDEQLRAATLRLPVADYERWYRSLPASLTDAVEETWGPPPGDQYVDDGDFVIAGIELGNVLVAIQPPRGYGSDQVGIYHDPELPATHHYLASYHWFTHVWAADAIVHLGKHGTLEWTPGKMLALSASCTPDAALGDTPLIYPFVVNDPGEGVQAKRRAHAVIVDHLVPPMMRADTYDEMAVLETLLDEYARLEVLDPSKLPGLAARIWTAVEAANLQADIGVEEEPADVGALVEHIDGYLCEVKDVQIKDGLHVLGQAPTGDQLRGLTSAMLRLGSAGVPGLRTAVGAAYGLDEPGLTAAPGSAAPVFDDSLVERFRGPASSAGDLVDRLETAHMALLDELAVREWDADAADAVCEDVLGLHHDGVVAALRLACTEVVPRIRGTHAELDNVLAALHGRHIPPGPSGAPTRGRLDVLPTGRNFYSVDPRSLPSKLSWDVGVRLADTLLDRHRADHDGAYPRMVGLVAWGTAAMRTQGDDVAEIFALLGVRPTWHPESGRVTDTEVVPLSELGRPRIDVTVRISGFFRDAFPHLVGLLDDAVSKVAALDESDAENYVAAHARADAERLAAELGDGASPSMTTWRRATMRVFGSKPGTYGAGLLQLVDARDWRDTGDIAQVYETWGGFAYGREMSGEPARDAMRDCHGRIEAAVKNVDSMEHDILDSDDYFQYHGGMVAMARAITGRAPAAYVGDSSDPSRVRARTLDEEARRVFRARVANPRWIASMVRHGYKGAAELAATVDYLFGYDATAGVAEDWMYEQVAEKYLLDEDMARFLGQSNPWAGRSIAERLLEAAERGLWEAPSDAALTGLRDRFLALEGELEEAGHAS